MNPDTQTSPGTLKAGGAPEGKLKAGCSLGWQLDRYAREEMMLTAGAVAPQRFPDLLRNCDLPPPLKVFSATPKKAGDAAGFPSPPPAGPLGGRKEGNNDGGTEPDRGGDAAQDHLLKALRLSQTRAREAERKAAALSDMNKQMASLLMEESLRLYAHRQWLKLLEMENSWLQKEGSMKGKADAGAAICLGIAGLGLVIGYRLMS